MTAVPTPSYRGDSPQIWIDKAAETYGACSECCPQFATVLSLGGGVGIVVPPFNAVASCIKTSLGSKIGEHLARFIPTGSSDGVAGRVQNDACSSPCGFKPSEVTGALAWE